MNVSSDPNKGTNIPHDPHNGTSSHSNTENQNNSPHGEESMVNQPELTLEEHFSNPANVQMTDRLLEKHGEEILAHLIAKGVKPPSNVDWSKYRGAPSNILQGSQDTPEGSYFPNVPPVEGWQQPEFGNAVLYQVNYPPHASTSVIGGPQVPDPNNPFVYGMPPNVPQPPPLMLTAPPPPNQPPVNIGGTSFATSLPPPGTTNLPPQQLNQSNVPPQLPPQGTS